VGVFAVLNDHDHKKCPFHYINVFSRILPCCSTFLCLPVAHKSKSIFVPCCGTFCAFLWHIVWSSRLRNIANEELQVKNCKLRIASQEFQVKNSKSRIPSQEFQVTSFKDFLAAFKTNEIIFSLVQDKTKQNEFSLI
jgi:hypothetical protein